MNVDKKTIYDRITEAVGMQKAADIAKALGVTPGAVSQWKIRGNISLENLSAVSLLTGVSIHWLITGEGEKLIRSATKGLALVRAPVVRLPAEDVRIEWLVTSITHKV